MFFNGRLRHVLLYTVLYLLQALLQKAELLLEQGDYENALKFFQNGARVRPDKEDFQDGIQKAKHGISEHHKGKILSSAPSCRTYFTSLYSLFNVFQIDFPGLLYFLMLAKKSSLQRSSQTLL